MPTFDVDELPDVFEQVLEEIESNLASDTSDALFEVLQEQSERTFDNAEDSDGNPWEPISPITLLTRENDQRVPNAPFRSVQAIIDASLEAKPLHDTGDLLESLLDETGDSVRDVDVGDGIGVFTFGTSREGAEKHQEGGEGSGLDASDIFRASQRVEGSANKFLNALQTGESGSVPQREFLYMDDEAIQDATRVTFETIVKSFQEVVE